MPFKDGIQYTTGGALVAHLRDSAITNPLYRNGWARDGDGKAFTADAGTAVPAGAQFHRGRAHTPDGALYVTEDIPTSGLTSDGVAVRADGAVHITTLNPSGQVVYGVGLDSYRRMYVSFDAVTGGNLLMEDGSTILLEDGFKLVLE